MNGKPCFLAGHKCKDIIYVISSDPQATFSCCGTDLQEMKANSTDGASEKHLPVVEREGNSITVKVGSIAHPMTEEHSIDWVFLETKKGGQFVYLKPDEEPVAHFVVADKDAPIAAYAYCNLHGFWKTEIQ